jgi:hypothetical protein
LDLLARANDAADLGPDILEADAQRLERAGCDAFLFAKQPEQQVLGADVVVLERAGLVLREDDGLPCSVGEALEQLER